MMMTRSYIDVGVQQKVIVCLMVRTQEFGDSAKVVNSYALALYAFMLVPR